MKDQTQQMNPLAIVLVLVVLWLMLSRPQPTPPTPPGPGPEPRPVSKIADRVREIVRRLVPAADRAATAAQLAAVYREIAADVERLKDPLHRSEIKRPQDVLTVADRRIEQTLANRSAAWHAARAEISLLLDDLQTRGEIGRSVYDVGRALGEVAAGLD
jgi:hypothetical protein